MAQSNRWTREQLLAAFALHCRLPFGEFHQHNPEIIALATVIERTPSAVAMKLSNFASLDSPTAVSPGCLSRKLSVKPRRNRIVQFPEYIHR